MTSRPERTCFSGLLTLNYLLENSNKIASKRSINSPESKKISGKESELDSQQKKTRLTKENIVRQITENMNSIFDQFEDIRSDLENVSSLCWWDHKTIPFHLFREVFSPNTRLGFVLHPTSKFLPICRLCDKQNIKFVPVVYEIYRTRQLSFNFSSPRLAEIKTKLTLGAGSSGAVVASRLSEDPSVTVLLVEAGGEEDLLTKVPLLATVAQFSNKDWNFRTTPQTHSCLGLNGRLTEVNKSSLVFPFSSHKKGRCSPWEASVWPRGKVLGGSSSINRLAYARGSIFDYDLWEKLGAKGWSYKDVLPYFIKSERNISPKYLQKDAHGFKGPMIVQDVPSVSALGKTLLNAAKFLKFVIKDYNDGYVSGFGLTQMTSYKGIRQSASRSFLQPIKRRTNLHVITKAFVEKVKINWLKRAEGIIMNRRGRTHFIRAKKEVILSAGAVQTPQILMLSGIGPKDVLRKHNIQIHSQVPGVGRNLQDHLITVTPIFVKSNFALGVFDYVNIPSFLKYLRGTGPIASTPGDVIGYAKTKYSDTGFSDIQIDSIGAAIDNIFFRRSYGIKESIFKSYLNPSPKGFSVSGIITVMLNPRSRGYITIKSSDPYEEPVINPRYLTDPYDVRVMIEGIKMAKKLINTPPYKKIEARVVDNILPPCKKFPLWSEDYLECFIRHLAVTFYHPVGTCKMGSLKDPLTVVDPLLRVRGITGLRIADSSIMPTIPSGNTNAPAIMIGEKAADIIKYTSTYTSPSSQFYLLFSLTGTT
ncbi:Glucose dehydrogenase [FAD, quinone] [Nymphon striatum]|nr:Glucose dehydrogenase [FAD, quinone] [Nymphon striatum]